MTMLSRRATVVTLLILAYFMWSTGMITIKLVLPWAGFLGVMTIRMIPPLLVYLLLWKRVQPVRWYREDIKWLAFMVLGDPLGTLFFQTHALQLTTASQSGMIFACMPLLMAAAARILFGEKIRSRCLAGMFCACIGVFLVALTGHATASAPRPLLGNLFAFLAVCCLLVYSLSVKQLVRHYTPQTLLFVQAVVSNLVQLPLFLLFWPTADLPAARPWWVIPAILYIGFFPACLGYYIVNRSLSVIKAAYVSLLNTTVPVFVLLLGFVVLDEKLLPAQYFGSALILCGAILAGLPEQSSTASTVQK